jgi:two-component system response regulator DevR
MRRRLGTWFTLVVARATGHAEAGRWPVARVAIIDDVREARTLIRVLLSRTSGTVVVAEEADMDEASLARVVASRPDVVVIDRRLPSGDGASVVARLRDLEPGAPKVLVYSIGDPFPAALLDEPDAYVLIDDDITLLAEATARLAAGTSPS